VTASTTVADANKENQRRFAIYNRAKVALARNDLATAKRESQQLTAAVATAGNPFQQRLAHEIAGRIALAEKRWDEAIAELRRANQLDPYNRYRLAQAYAARAVPGDRERAEELARGARNDNTLANLNLALLRQEKSAG
jgi:tetratricopeptide (TPR) repeat protein